MILAAIPSLAERSEPILELRGRLASQARSQSVEIRVFEWSSDEDRAALRQALIEGGDSGLFRYLSGQPEVARVRYLGGEDYSIGYAFQFIRDGKQHIELYTHHPLAQSGVGGPAPGTVVSFVYLQLDSETGKGEGMIVGGAQFRFDESTGRMVMKTRETQLPLRGVKPRKTKKTGS